MKSALRKTYITLLFLNLISLTGVLAQDEIIGLNDRRELFVDSFLIDRIEGLEIIMHHPIDEGPVFYFDKPWEGKFSGYCTIIKDDNLFKAYYRGLPEAGQDGGSMEVTCYAESGDGINWIKPDLGIFERDSSKNNNIIPVSYTHLRAHET